MGRFLIKVADDEFIEWSTVVDAPITYVLSKKEMAVHLQEEYGDHGLRESNVALERAEEFGHSARVGERTAEELIESPEYKTLEDIRKKCQKPEYPEPMAVTIKACPVCGRVANKKEPIFHKTSCDPKAENYGDIEVEIMIPSGYCENINCTIDEKHFEGEKCHIFGVD